MEKIICQYNSCNIEINQDYKESICYSCFEQSCEKHRILIKGDIICFNCLKCEECDCNISNDYYTCKDCDKFICYDCKKEHPENYNYNYDYCKECFKKRFKRCELCSTLIDIKDNSKTLYYTQCCNALICYDCY